MMLAGNNNNNIHLAMSRKSHSCSIAGYDTIIRVCVRASHSRDLFSTSTTLALRLLVYYEYDFTLYYDSSLV